MEKNTTELWQNFNEHISVQSKQETHTQKNVDAHYKLSCLIWINLSIIGHSFSIVFFSWAAMGSICRVFSQ